MTDSLWAGGPKAYAKAIRKQYKRQLNELRKRRDSANDADRAEFDTEIERVEAEYKSKLDSIDDALF